jgi:hypothetical protein
MISVRDFSCALNVQLNVVLNQNCVKSFNLTYLNVYKNSPLVLHTPRITNI